MFLLAWWYFPVFSILNWTTKCFWMENTYFLFKYRPFFTFNFQYCLKMIWIHRTDMLYPLNIQKIVNDKLGLFASTNQSYRIRKYIIITKRKIVFDSEIIWKVLTETKLHRVCQTSNIESSWALCPLNIIIIVPFLSKFFVHLREC